jgi:hypothetical protein
MALQDDLPTKSERRPKSRRLSGAREVDVSASLEEFIGSACAILDEPIAEPAPVAEPEPVPAPEPDPIAERMAQIEEALVRAATRAAALTEVPPPRRRGRLGLSAASAAVGAFLGVVVLLIGFGRSQDARPVAAQPAQAAPAPIAQPAAAQAIPAPAAAQATPARIVQPETAPPSPAASTSSPAAAPPAASSPPKPARHKVVPSRRLTARKAGGSGGIVDPFANQ